MSRWRNRKPRRLVQTAVLPVFGSAECRRGADPGLGELIHLDATLGQLHMAGGTAFVAGLGSGFRLAAELSN